MKKFKLKNSVINKLNGPLSYKSLMWSRLATTVSKQFVKVSIKDSIELLIKPDSLNRIWSFIRRDLNKTINFEKKE